MNKTKEKMGKDKHLILRDQNDEAGWLGFFSALVISVGMLLVTLLTFNILFLLITLFFFYLCYGLFADIFNKHELWFARNELIIVVKPIPVWGFNKKVAYEMVEQAFIDLTRSRYGVYYVIRLKLKDEKPVTFTGTSSHGRAVEFKNTINSALKERWKEQK